MQLLLRSLALLVAMSAHPAPGQDDRKTVTVEVYLPESARLFIEGQEMRFQGPTPRFVSPGRRSVSAWSSRDGL